MTEEWADIAIAEGYKVSTMGRVRSPRGRILKPQTNGKYGYLWVYMGRGAREYIHRLVAASFIASVEGMDVDHSDGDTSNNAVSNLRVMSHAENMRAQRERKTHCKRGHSLEDCRWVHGRRQCRTCERIRDRQRYARRSSSHLQEVNA